ncbi:MAG: hypothetical protein JRD93_10920 [Deltaproteobacteria bacterium]|nr:hypothetical protein [Deltaproteobacteria bacterium]MBW2662475.1 hypothetical protein [Deltaproteobacteria bacterium]
MTKPKLIVVFTTVFFTVIFCSFIFFSFLLHPGDLFAAERPYYIGNRKCRLCHFEYFRGWEKDPHANAFVRLGRMQNNPYCLKCHTTGFNGPQGFVSEKITPGLRGVQCEACHGPGSKHKDSPYDKKALWIGRKIDYQSVCIKCHDRNWTPEFDYEKYRKRIEHKIEIKAGAKAEKKVLPR